MVYLIQNKVQNNLRIIVMITEDYDDTKDLKLVIRFFHFFHSSKSIHIEHLVEQ